jgi:hypothetical protein
VTVIARLMLIAFLVPASGVAAEPADTTEEGSDRHVVMYKDPNCGCCEKWADHLRAHGFTVDSRPTTDMLGIKKLRNIPPRGSSCHTADVAGYVIEGHVPAGDIKRLLADRPDDIRVLTVPAMPLGSPGMEHPRPQNFRTFAIKTDESVEIYAEHAAGEDFSPADD